MKVKKIVFVEKTHKRPKVIDFGVAIVVNVILLLLLNKLQNVKLIWLTNTAIIAITLFELSFAAQILGNIILLMRTPYILRQIIKITLNVVSFLSLYALYILYPFNFAQINVPAWTDMMVKIFIILSMIGLIIAIIFEMVKIFQQEKVYNLKKEGERVQNGF